MSQDQSHHDSPISCQLIEGTVSENSTIENTAGKASAIKPSKATRGNTLVL